MKEFKSGEIKIDTPGKPVRMFLTHHAPKAVQKWWMPLAIAILGAIQAFSTNGMSQTERDARDEDIVKLQKSNEAQWQIIGNIRERVAYLEGKGSAARETTHQPPLPTDIKVDKAELDKYKESRK
jgi:hypothetical protein